MPPISQATPIHGRVLDVFMTFLKLGLTSFGGPVAHLGYFRRELVERQGWLSDGQYSQLLALCQFLPGPASSQLGFALGLQRAGWGGAFAAFLAFTLPSALLMLALATALPQLSGPVVEAVIQGLKLVACAVVADAVWGMSKTLCPDPVRRVIALAAVAIVLAVPTAWSQLLVVILGGLVGLALCRQVVAGDSAVYGASPSRRLGPVLLALFFTLLALALWWPAERGLTAIAGDFYQAGALVFGGGHVVLPLLEQAVVATGLLSGEQFLAGYGAAQAIPGPMFAFAAYLGALIPGDQAPWLGAAVALGSIFLPGFLLVAATMPLWRDIADHRAMRRAVAGVNAAVVGILAAALWDPIVTAGIGGLADLVIALVALALLRVWRLSPLAVVIWCVAANLFARLVIAG